MALSYEEQRIQNIKDNEALLLSLGLGAPSLPKAQPKKAIQKSKKKDEGDSTFKPEKTIRPIRALPKPKPKPAEGTANNSEDGEATNGLRRSTRSSGRTTIRPNYTGESPLWKEDVKPILSRSSTKRSRDNDNDEQDEEEEDEEDRWRQRKAQRLGIRTEDPKQFGHITGVEVGRCWATRMDCSTDAVHAPTVAGISGNAQEGAWSVALSGGYPDDVDLGYAFTYTGSGGRDLKGTKQNPKNLRTAEQSYDQSFNNTFNAALKKSSETRKPVRVIRGYKLPSVYAPAEGYRYDGLYIVEKAWMARGLTKGLMVCRYAFKRVEAQSELPVRSEEEEEEDEGIVEGEAEAENVELDGDGKVDENEEETKEAGAREEEEENDLVEKVLAENDTQNIEVTHNNDEREDEAKDFLEIGSNNILTEKENIEVSA
ncbi:hypothetical protein I302_102859 [Kwoniella bestiolae CBS 10118]|uniref:YDG domain-containing protein n=1 Tax=Kwoniella bestiolae CBS 10118 TaxID=1296100 RepID=A0A1B9GG81_9TREE|nr:hypothetical protein I302_01554 [Kwoniella bestiolae CBS 10118]OCF30036.1 hypothetical protein I302_01554 [Kwoniella bestiolae CBS 10118]